MYFKHGKAFSLLDWQRGYGHVQIEVPHRYMPLIMLFSQCADLPNIRLPPDPSDTGTYQIRKRPKCYVYEADDMDRSRKAKYNRSEDRVDKRIEDYITVYAAIPAMTIPLRVKRAELLQNTYGPTKANLTSI